jgi:hypothetical protein
VRTVCGHTSDKKQRQKQAARHSERDRPAKLAVMLRLEMTKRKKIILGIPGSSCYRSADWRRANRWTLRQVRTAEFTDSFAWRNMRCANGAEL